MVNMGLLHCILLFFLPLSFGFPNRNSELQSEWDLATSEFPLQTESDLSTSEFPFLFNRNSEQQSEVDIATSELPFLPNRDSEQQSEWDLATSEFPLQTESDLSTTEFPILSTSEPEEEDFCPPNEFFSPCLAHCQRNCSNWSDPSMKCLKICVPGCICNNGMVRGPYGNCIQPRKCPRRLDSLLSVPGDILLDCPVEEHYDRCNAHCQPNCSNWDQEIECTEICVSGCVCDKGFVRGPNGKCVLSEKCSSMNQKPKINMKKKSENTCPEGELRSNLLFVQDSITHCISTRGDLQSCPPTLLNGCVCKKGQVRAMDSQQCIYQRLQPDANEIHFIRDPLESSSNLEIFEEFVSFNELTKDHTFASTNMFPSYTSTIETNKNNAAGDFSTTTQELSTDKSIGTKVEYHGCPSHDQCRVWCWNNGFTYGACVGGPIVEIYCACFN